MILHDRVIVVTGGYRDGGGNVLPIVKVGPFPAEMRPLRSSENMGKVDRGNESCSIFWTFTVDMGPT